MSSSTNPGDRSSAEIERDVERTRARLTGTVEELRDRVSPGQLADQAVDWLRGSGGRDFLRNLGTSLRDNPMPVLLVAAGIGWMALGGQRMSDAQDRRGQGRWRSWEGESYPGETFASGYVGESYPPETYVGQGGYSGDGSSTTERLGEAASNLRDSASDMAGRVGDTASRMRDSASDAAARVGDMAARTGDAASGALHSAKDRVSAMTHGASRAGGRVAGRAGDALHYARGTAYDLGERASHASARVRRNVADTLESQPLLIGALGLTLGAALGAMFRSTEAEDRLMGETRDRMANRMASVAGSAYEQARETTEEHLARAGERLGEAYGNARERLAESGVSPKQGAAALGEMARDLRDAVERTAQDAAGAAKGATEGPGGEPGPRRPASGPGSSDTGPV
jgi:hypothetical protein